MKFSKFNRLFHRWASIVIAVPVLIVIASGILLLLKKESDWLQPPTQRGGSQDLVINFDTILAAVRDIPEMEVETWKDIDRLDVRPNKGMLKVRAANRWELQLDTQTGEVLQLAYRRTDVIESLHDGTFFHDKAKLWLFLPSGITLLGLWMTGIYLFLLPSLVRRKRKAAKA